MGWAHPTRGSAGILQQIWNQSRHALMPFQRGGGGLPDLSPPPLILLEGMSHDKFLKALWRVLQLLVFPFFFLQRRVCKAAERNHGFAVDKHLYARSEGGVCSLHAISACYQVRWLQLLVMVIENKWRVPVWTVVLRRWVLLQDNFVLSTELIMWIGYREKMV